MNTEESKRIHRSTQNGEDAHRRFILSFAKANEKNICPGKAWGQPLTIHFPCLIHDFRSYPLFGYAVMGLAFGSPGQGYNNRDNIQGMV